MQARAESRITPTFRQVAIPSAWSPPAPTAPGARRRRPQTWFCNHIFIRRPGSACCAAACSVWGWFCGCGPASRRARQREQALTALVEARTRELRAEAAERQQAEAAARGSEKRYRELFDDAPIGYHELDLEGRLVRVNSTELRMLGYEAAEMIGR